MDVVQLVIVILPFAVLFIISLLLILRNKRFSNKNHLPLPPGPKPWPIIGNLGQIGAMPHHSLAAMARTYGPLFHLKLGSVHVVVAASASAASQFLKTHNANFSNRPPNSTAKYTAYNLSGSCVCSLWTKEEVGMLTQAQVEAARRKAQVNLGQLLTVCTTNEIGRATLGFRVFVDGYGGDSRDEKRSSEFKKMLVYGLALGGQLANIGDFIPCLDWLDLQGVVSKMKKSHKKFDDFLNKIIQEHKENHDDTGGHKDILSVLLGLKKHADSEGGTLTDIDIKALLLDFFIAGTDSSASTAEWAMAELIQHPNILAKAQNELDLVVGRDRLVTESDLGQLTYFQAIIKEIFRLHPAVPLIPRIASENCEINGYLIPKNSSLLVNVWAIGRDPDVWPNPYEFQPERFLAGQKHCDVDVRGNDFEMIPFGAGRRICVGLNLGLRMVQLMVASLVHEFEWELPEEQAKKKLNMEEAYGLTLHRKVPLLVCPKPRLPLHAYATNFDLTRDN